MSKDINCVIEWDGFVREGVDDQPIVLIHYTAGGWVGRSEQTWEQPAEGGLHEDINITDITIDPSSEPCDPLTEAEKEQARKWFHSDDHKIWDEVQRIAEKKRENDNSVAHARYFNY